MFEDFSQVEAFFQKRKQYGVKPGLDRIQKLLELLGNPQEKVDAIHVAGTNGKGSTINYLKNALMRNGYGVGVFISPSLEGLTGHILLNEIKISEKELIHYVNVVFPFIKRLDRESNHPTEFEMMTAISFLYFADNADFTLIEAGMGGREDTTNCFTPILSIITNVEWDHTDFLGKTVKSIASHKAGIIKENRPVVAGEMSEEAMRIITGEAFDKNAPLYQSGEHFWCKMVNKTTQHQTFEWLSSSGMRMDVKLKTAGSHQIKNASLAVMTLTILQDEGFDLDWDLCAAGVADVKIPGRFEQVHSNPPIILDAAHNVSGVHAFTETLTDDFYDMEKHLIFAVFKDKDFKRMLEDLGPHFTSIILTTFDHPRAADPEQLQKYCDHPDTQVFSNWQQAAEQINLKQKNKCYCVTGSLHFIAIMRKYFEEAIELQ